MMNDQHFMKYVKCPMIYDLTILPLLVVVLWYFWSVGVIGMIFDAFWYHLCIIVVFDGFESLILDLCGYLLIRMTDSQTDYASSSVISILG